MIISATLQSPTLLKAGCWIRPLAERPLLQTLLRCGRWKKLHPAAGCTHLLVVHAQCWLLQLRPHCLWMRTERLHWRTRSSAGLLLLSSLRSKAAGVSLEVQQQSAWLRLSSPIAEESDQNRSDDDAPLAGGRIVFRCLYGQVPNQAEACGWCWVTGQPWWRGWRTAGLLLIWRTGKAQQSYCNPFLIPRVQIKQ